MSRIIIKGLPRRFEEKELRELFSFAGEVTDAKVIRDREGKSRQFAFVGFRNESDAARARRKINGTYVHTSRVLVDFARPPGDAALPRPWSKHSVGSSAHAKRAEAQEREQAMRFRAETRARAKEVAERKKALALSSSNIAEKDRETFNAFKDAASKRGRAPVWADGDEVPKERKDTKEHAKNADDDSNSSADSSDDDDEYQDLPANSSAKENEVEDAEVDRVALDEGVSDADYFKSKVSGDADVDDESEEEDEGDDDDDDDSSDSEGSRDGVEGSGDADGAKETGEAKTEKMDSAGLSENREVKKGESANPSKHSSKNSEAPVDAGETGRLFVRNLAFNVEEEDLEKLFEKFGTLAEVHVVVDSFTKRSRGVALISFVVPEDAPKAMAALDGTVFCGRLLHVLPGRPKPTARRGAHSAQVEGVGMNKFKRDREEARIEAARSGADGDAQNVMHLAADAVADTMAARLGVSKSELLGSGRAESGTAAVRLTVAEATVQAETRQFLLANGIDLKKVEATSATIHANTTAAKKSRLSRTAFLVKNLPAGTKRSELEGMFTKFGTLSRLAIAPSSLLAIVEYSTAGEAKRAYAGSAYRRFRDIPLYLEWLPVEAMTSSEAKEPAKSNSDEMNSTALGHDTVDAAENTKLVNSGSVYVKNLNFDTDDEQLKTHFKQVLKKRPDVLKGFRAATVSTKRSTKDGAEVRLSMGFGFAEFSSHALAAEAVKIAQGSVLDGHTLELRLSKRRAEISGSVGKRKRPGAEHHKPSAKIIVRNVAFEASVREVRELFANFGQLKSVRLPRKMDGSHRGFGFIEFVSSGEAKNAKEALTDAHLYGRHLVIEYADEDAAGVQSMEKLVEHAAKEAAKNKKRRTDAGSLPDSGELDERIRDELYN